MKHHGHTYGGFVFAISERGMTCAPINPTCWKCERASCTGCNLLRSFLATPSPQGGRGMGWLSVNMGSNVEVSFLR
jgi:hypothetical protein